MKFAHCIVVVFFLLKKKRKKMGQIFYVYKQLRGPNQYIPSYNGNNTTNQ